jgi:hypothetical protein
VNGHETHSKSAVWVDGEKLYEQTHYIRYAEVRPGRSKKVEHLTVRSIAPRWKRRKAKT